MSSHYIRIGDELEELKEIAERAKIPFEII